MDVIEEISAERRRQINDEGWTAEHDDKHQHGELAAAAACYALQAADHWMRGIFVIGTLWPWEMARWKPSAPRRDLIKAAALIVAEIKRLDRVLS